MFEKSSPLNEQSRGTWGCRLLFDGKLLEKALHYKLGILSVNINVIYQELGHSFLSS